MILGRNTQQWIGLISAALSLILTTLGALTALGMITVDALQAATVILGGVGGFLGVFVAFIANTYTTPVNDPQIERGTVIRVTDAAGRVIDHQKLTVTPPAPESGKKVMTGQVNANK